MRLNLTMVRPSERQSSELLRSTVMPFDGDLESKFTWTQLKNKGVHCQTPHKRRWGKFRSRSGRIVGNPSRGGLAHNVGSIPILSFTADAIRCVQPR
jgi:hypothetical protein